MAINAAPPYQSVPLSEFLGLYTEASPESVPEGASPLCWDVDFVIGGVKMRPGKQPFGTFTGSAGNQDFNWIKSYLQSAGTLSTLALDSSGTLWDENVSSAPGTFTSVYSRIRPGSFAKSVTLDDVEYICLSDLTSGYDIPRQWDGETLNRTSQVGPGAGPSISFNATTYTISGIVQSAPVKAFYYLLWSAGPTLRNAGNVATFYFPVGTDISAIQPGLNIVIAGLTGAASDLNSASTPYIVQTVGTAIGAGGGSYPVFTVIAPSTNFVDINISAMGASYQLTSSVLTTNNPVPNLQTGGQMSVAGASPSDWNATWTVQNVLNGAQLQINSTVLASNVATYSYTIISGTAPTVGEQVTVVNTTNGDGIFNVVNAIVSAVAGGSFSVQITSPDIASAVEQGGGIINGTEFQFDPGKVIANGSGGAIGLAGGLGSGTRQAVVMFLTDSDYLTQPSPFIEFTLPSDAASIIVNNLPIGPPNVKARVVAFTGANGGNFYWIPTPVMITSNGQQVTYDATIVNDNTSHQATFSFTDAVLLAADEIDIQGNNLFEQKELGPSLGCIAYANRMFYWGELAKINNFKNMSFDGGIAQYVPPGGAPTDVVSTSPLGWTPDPDLGLGISVVPSIVFGNSMQVDNATGLEQTFWGLITQPAFEDQYGVTILDANVSYSVRISLRSLAQITGGGYHVNLFSPSISVPQNTNFGDFVVPLNVLTSEFQVFTGTLTAAQFSTLPSDLQLRLFCADFPNGASLQVDRLEIFPTKSPVLGTQLTASYRANFEAFDQVTGVVDTAQENPQPVYAGFTLFATLYAVKSHSLVLTQDNNTTEPNGWTIRTVSVSVGTTSVNGVDFVNDTDQGGENYAIIAGRPGVYLFDGGEPIPIHGEIRSLWNSINWKAESTLWIKNDIIRRRMVIGVPLPTPNIWLPNAPVNANPTTPNVCIAMSYLGADSVGSLIEAAVRNSAFTGKLLARDSLRKWTIWQIQSPYADFIERQDGSVPLFFGNSQGNGKIYELAEDSFNDDGAAINQTYTTYGFVSNDTAIALQMGVVRKFYNMARILVGGSGSLGITVIPNNLYAPAPYRHNLIPLALSTMPLDDLELPLNEMGERLFFQFSTNAAGQYFNMSRLAVMLRQETYSPVRGRN